MKTEQQIEEAFNGLVRNICRIGERGSSLSPDEKSILIRAAGILSWVLDLQDYPHFGISDHLLMGMIRVDEQETAEERRN